MRHNKCCQSFTQVHRGTAHFPNLVHPGGQTQVLRINQFTEFGAGLTNFTGFFITMLLTAYLCDLCFWPASYPVAASLSIPNVFRCSFYCTCLRLKLSGMISSMTSAPHNCSILPIFVQTSQGVQSNVLYKYMLIIVGTICLLCFV